MNLGHIDSQGDSSAVMSMSDARDADSFMDSSASEMLVNMNYSSLEEIYPAAHGNRYFDACSERPNAFSASQHRRNCSDVHLQILGSSMCTLH
jgi:hypothetical protein